MWVLKLPHLFHYAPPSTPSSFLHPSSSLPCPSSFSVSFIPKETRSCQLLRKGGCFEGAAVPVPAFSYFTPRKVCRLRKSWRVASFNLTATLLSVSGCKCHFHGVMCCTLMKISLNLWQFSGIMWLFTVTSAIIFLKKNLKQMRELWITCSLLL